jgi:hypothetical protein
VRGHIVPVGLDGLGEVELRDRDGAGEIVVKYGSWDELDRLLEDLLKA